MNESDQYKDGGSDGQYTREHEGRYDDEPEGKREDNLIESAAQAVEEIGEDELERFAAKQAQAAPAHTQVDQVWPLADCIAEVWQQWHAVPYDNAHMNFAVRSLFHNREQIAQTRAACDALAEALLLALPALEYLDDDAQGVARAALAQWEEAKK